MMIILTRNRVFFIITVILLNLLSFQCEKINQRNDSECEYVRNLENKLENNNFAIRPLRYQDPLPPFPYKEEEIEFKNKKENIILSGTLTYKDNINHNLCVVLAHPSGGDETTSSRDSDYTHEQHKTFLILADYLTRENIAVLR
jgi:hypothetical protein